MLKPEEFLKQVGPKRAARIKQLETSIDQQLLTFGAQSSTEGEFLMPAQNFYCSSKGELEMMLAHYNTIGWAMSYLPAAGYEESPVICGQIHVKILED